MKYESPYFEFIENNHPQYYSDDRVLLCDILFRYITDDGVSEDDLEWIERTIKTKSEALQELKRLEALLFSEACQAPISCKPLAPHPIFIFSSINFFLMT